MDIQIVDTIHMYSKPFMKFLTTYRAKLQSIVSVISSETGLNLIYFPAPNMLPSKKNSTIQNHIRIPRGMCILGPSQLDLFAGMTQKNTFADDSKLYT